jgi:hypothetical protein
MTASREISISAAIALAQAAANPQPDPGMAPGCVLAATLRPGGVFYRPSGRSLGELDGFMITELLPVTVLRGPEPDFDSDVFGRELIKFWCRSDLTGREGRLSFGPGGVVRVEPDPPYFVIATEVPGNPS